MSKKKEIKQLESLLEDALEHLRCDVRDGDLSDSVWAQDVDALMAGIRALKAQEVAETQPANATAKAELLRTLCKAVASHQNPWDVGIMDQLLAAWDAGAEIADPLTVALLAPKLEWAKQCLARDPYLTDEVYAKLLLAVIPAVCPELREQEENADDEETAEYRKDVEALSAAISALEGLERNRAKAENAVKAMQICFGLAQDIERLLTLAYLQGGGDDEQS